MNSEKGMTLIEVLITVLILTMLTSIAVLSVGFYINEGKTRIAEGDLATLKAASRIYILDKETTPPSLVNLVNTYIPELPKDPFAAGTADYLLASDAGMLYIYSVGPNRVDDSHAGDDIVVTIAIL